MKMRESYNYKNCSLKDLGLKIDDKLNTQRIPIQAIKFVNEKIEDTSPKSKGLK